MIPEGAFDLNDVEVLQKRDASLQIQCDEIGTKWIPRSVIVDDDDADHDEEYEPGHKRRILVASWFAEKKGWL